jgi:hypothetical protein
MSPDLSGFRQPSTRPDLRALTIGNAVHNVHRDRAEIVNAEVLVFLSE